MSIGSLFTGYGGLDRAVQQVMGGEVRWHAEYEPPSKANPNPSQAAARLLAHHYPGTPNLGDVSSIDWAQVEPVDVLTGGFPCTDVSLAGVGAGLRAGNRSGMWNHMASAVAVLRPQLVVIENVRGLLSAVADSALEPCPWCVGHGSVSGLRALGAVLGDLASIGYDARWCGLRAAAVGAPHGRFRIFITAWAAGNSDSVDRDGGSSAGFPRETGPQVGLVADSAGDGRDEGRPEPTGLVWGSDAAVGGHGSSADADGFGSVRSGHPWGGWAGLADHDRAAPYTGDDGREGGEERHLRSEGGEPTPLRRDSSGRVLDWGAYAPAIRRWERVLGRVAPAPTQLSTRGGTQLSPRFVEWMQGLPAGWVTDVPGITRGDQLRMLGNGVVPQQAVAALRFLLAVDAAAVA